MPFPYKITNSTLAPNKIYPQLTGYKFLVLGHAEHGKDTICDILQNVYGMTSVSSSWYACENVVMPAFFENNQDQEVYASVDSCYADRANHRKFWFDAIAAYNHYEPQRLAIDLLTEYDVYNGMRNPLEYQAVLASNLFDEIFWVDASFRKPLEAGSSMRIPYDSSMRVINNNLNVACAASDLHDHMNQILSNINSTAQDQLSK